MANTIMTRGGMDDTTLSPGWAVKNGAVAGVIAGVVFAIGEVLGATMMMGQPLMPFHMFASVPLQREPTAIDQGTALLVGTISHMAYSVVFGVIVALIVASVRALRASRTATLVFSIVVGLVSWPLNFFVIAPLIGAPWFAQQTEPMQLIAQALFHVIFGGIIG